MKREQCARQVRAYKAKGVLYGFDYQASDGAIAQVAGGMDRVPVGAGGFERGANETQVGGFARPGNDGIRHLGGRFGGYRDFGYHAVPPEDSGAVGRDRERHQRFVMWRAAQHAKRAAKRVVGRVYASEHGQSTIEFAIVTAGLLAVVMGISALWHAFDGGLFVRHALSCASHAINDVYFTTLFDLFLY